MNGAMTFFCSCYQNNHFQGNVGTLKIRLLQCYEVLWIHNINAICLIDFQAAMANVTEFNQTTLENGAWVNEIRFAIEGVTQGIVGAAGLLGMHNS